MKRMRRVITNSLPGKISTRRLVDPDVIAPIESRGEPVKIEAEGSALVKLHLIGSSGYVTETIGYRIRLPSASNSDHERFSRCGACFPAAAEIAWPREQKRR